MKKYGLEASSGNSVENSVNPNPVKDLAGKRKTSSSPLKLVKFKKIMTKTDTSVCIA